MKSKPNPPFEKYKQWENKYYTILNSDVVAHLNGLLRSIVEEEQTATVDSNRLQIMVLTHNISIFKKLELHVQLYFKEFEPHHTHSIPQEFSDSLDYQRELLSQRLIKELFEEKKDSIEFYTLLNEALKRKLQCQEVSFESSHSILKISIRELARLFKRYNNKIDQPLPKSSNNPLYSFFHSSEEHSSNDQISNSIEARFEEIQWLFNATMMLNDIRKLLSSFSQGEPYHLFSAEYPLFLKAYSLFSDNIAQLTEALNFKQSELVDHEASLTETSQEKDARWQREESSHSMHL